MAETKFDLDRIKTKMLRKYPAFGSTISSVKYQIVGNNHPVKTAATDGKIIFVNTEFMASLSEDEQVFTMAHEVCHIALRHIQRSKGKDQRLWNIATDGVINQHLKKDGLSMPEGGVDIADALEFDAEELYQKLLEEKEQQQKQRDQTNGHGEPGEQGEQAEQQGQSQGQGSNQDKQKEEQNEEQQGTEQGQAQQEQDSTQSDMQEEREDSQVGHDDHSMWENAVRQEEQDKQKDTDSEEQKQSPDNKKEQSISEKDVFEHNEEEKIKRAEEVMRKINGTRRGFYGQSHEVCFGDIGEAGEPVANWKKLLIKTLEIEDEAWGHKFSDRASGWTARIEDVEYDEEAETEIILDTSGSVSVNLLKNFLRQVKAVLKNSTIKVGTFSDNFHGFVEIKRESDIDNLTLRVGGGTNFDAASRAFTKRKGVNKICFTDGQDDGDAGIENKRKDIVWISFENPNFKPDNGKVLFVPKNQIDFQQRQDDQEFSL